MVPFYTKITITLLHLILYPQFFCSCFCSHTLTFGTYINERNFLIKTMDKKLILYTFIILVTRPAIHDNQIYMNKRKQKK